MEKKPIKYFYIGIIVAVAIIILFFVNKGFTGNITGSSVLGESKQIGGGFLLLIAGFFILVAFIVMYLIRFKKK